MIYSRIVTVLKKLLNILSVVGISASLVAVILLVLMYLFPCKKVFSFVNSFRCPSPWVSYLSNKEDYDTNTRTGVLISLLPDGKSSLFVKGFLTKINSDSLVFKYKNQTLATIYTDSKTMYTVFPEYKNLKQAPVDFPVQNLTRSDLLIGQRYSVATIYSEKDNRLYAKLVTKITNQP